MPTKPLVKKLNLGQHDRLILAICLAIALASLYFLNDPSLFLSNSDQNLKEIGKITQIEKDVRLKSVGSYFWDEARPFSKISNGQSLFTGDQSNTEVMFTDGKKISIAENSLVQFRMLNNEITLDFSFGEISAQNLKQKIKIVICGKTYEINPEEASEFKLKRSQDCGSLNVNVQKGQIKLNNKKVTPLAEFIEKPATVVATPDPKPEVVQQPPEEITQAPVVEPPPVIETAPKIELAQPKLTSPSIKHRITSQTLPKVKWAEVTGADRYEIEWSYSNKFNKAEKAVVEKTEFEFSQNPARKLFYRTRALSSISDPGPFSAIGEINPTYPFIKITENEITFTYQAKSSMDKGPPRKFDISWSEVPNVENYEIEVSRSTKFDKVAKIRSKEAKTTLNLPMTGIYYWRVSALAKDGKVITQSQEPASVNYSRMFDLETPEVPDKYRDASFFFQKTAARFIWISWSASKNSNAIYKVDVSSEPTFNTILKSYTSDKPTLLIREQFPEGLYYWRVRSEVDTIVSDWTSPSKFRILTGAKRGTAGQ